MDCNEFKKYISSFLQSEEFDRKLREEFESHFFECDDCFKAYQIMNLMLDKEIKKLTLKEMDKLLLKAT